MEAIFFFCGSLSNQGGFLCPALCTKHRMFGSIQPVINSVVEQPLFLRLQNNFTNLILNEFLFKTYNQPFLSHLQLMISAYVFCGQAQGFSSFSKSCYNFRLFI